MRPQIIVIILIFIAINVNSYRIYRLSQCPTKDELITICDSIVKADSLTIFDKKNIGRLERYILIQGLVLTGELEPEALYPEIQWFIDRNEQRIEEENEKFND